MQVIDLIVIFYFSRLSRAEPIIITWFFKLKVTHHVGLLVDDVISKYAQNVDCSNGVVGMLFRYKK